MCSNFFGIQIMEMRNLNTVKSSWHHKTGDNKIIGERHWSFENDQHLATVSVQLIAVRGRSSGE